MLSLGEKQKEEGKKGLPVLLLLPSRNEAREEIK